MLHPDEIYAKFVRWQATNGTLAELDDCIWALLDDVIDSIKKAEGNDTGPITTEVTDYLSNYYGD